MEKYNPSEIEGKWQEFWAKNEEHYKVQNGSEKPKKYILDMFPYPSGEGLHAGHVESYTATDIISRYSRMKGFNVLHPQGFDAFGLPAENYAIKTKSHPSITTKKAIATFTEQMKMMGFSYDWDRQVVTAEKEYYKWTQWIFLMLYKNGLAYKKKAKVNWCDNCQTVLANEQAEGGICDRCQNPVIQKDLEQWFFKITDFIEDKISKEVRPLATQITERGRTSKTSGLISGLKNVDWPSSTKSAQVNWIGRSEGTEIEFRILNSEFRINVYTTRVDTIFGCTYCVIAPEHKIIQNLKSQISNLSEVEKYITETKKKTDLDRMEAKEKTGVELKGIKVINPFTNEAIGLFAADYVLGHYGTGAVMAVPAHDERDFEFAKKYNLEIIKSIDSAKTYIATIKRSLNDKFYNDIKKFSQIVENNGLVKIYSEEVDKIFNLAQENFIGEPWYIHSEGLIKKILFYTKKESKIFDWSDKSGFDDAYKYGLSINIKKEQLDWNSSCEATVDDGILINSENYSGLTSEEAREKMTAWLEEKKLGEKKINYRLRDWLVSRQRYWGAPIPIIYCEKCGEVPVPEKDLPVELPDDVDFNPTGESPLVKSEKFHDVVCPKCGGKARRESDTMDTFVCSSWYYLRYADPKNAGEFASKEMLQKWLPVDLYVGGAEHSVLHLLYARFFTKVLHSLGFLEFDEPFMKLRHQGMIMAEDGRKMSKSLGNVVNPNDMVKEFGADSLRMFEMFMGPLEDAKPWNTKGIIGIYRFLEKVYKLQAKIGNGKENKKLENLLHKTIKKVEEDIDDLKFNTAISTLMILVNEMEKEKEISKSDYQLLITILSPFAPHIAEELWNNLGNKNTIFLEKWPEFNPEAIKDEEFELIVQISGKVRDKIKVQMDISENEAKEIAMQSEKVKSNISGKEIRKIIFVKNRLINIVI